MYAALLACGVFSAHGWELRELQEAGISLYLPAEPILAQAGPDPSQPQSVERIVWQSQGMGVTATVTYERWKSPQFAPDASLELMARRQLGLQKGFIIQPAVLGGHLGSLLLVQDVKGVTRAVTRAKSGKESWQIDVRPNEGTLDEETLNGLQESVAISAAPEQEGLYTAWGTLNAQVVPAPLPRPLPERPTVIQGSGLSLKLPLEVVQKERQAEPGSTEVFSSIKEWKGSEGGIDVALSYFQLRASQSLDLGGWVAAYGRTLEKEGFSNLSPNVEEVKKGAAQGRRIVAKAESPTGGALIQVILLTKGQKCWAIQVRTPKHSLFDSLQEEIFRSIKVLE